MSAGDLSTESFRLCEPLPGVSYPVKVEYCGVCTMPFEYCEFGGTAEKCKQWLESNLPTMFAELHPGDAGSEEQSADGDKKRQKRGGKGQQKAGKKVESAVEQKICLSRAPRGRKSVTVISGLSSCGIDLKVASKFFAQKFACGSSVTGPDEIVIQGDVKDDLFDEIPAKWKQVQEDLIEDLGDIKR